MENGRDGSVIMRRMGRSVEEEQQLSQHYSQAVLVVV